MDLTPTGDWLYFSEEDPYCYIDLIYDTYWFEEDSPKAHCAEQMRKMGCLLISYHEHPSEWKLLSFKNSVDCAGVKNTRKQILSGKYSWKQVFVFDSEWLTIFGQLFVVFDGDYVIQVCHTCMQNHDLWN